MCCTGDGGTNVLDFWCRFVYSCTYSVRPCAGSARGLFWLPMVVRCERCGRVLCELTGRVFYIHHHRRRVAAPADYMVFICEKCGLAQKVMPDGEIVAIPTPELAHPD